MTLARVEVVSYRPEWPHAFAAEAMRLRALLGPIVVQVEHVGSTSVPGLAAKPVIDMLMAASSLKALDEATPGLTALGYQARGEFGIPGRRYFTLGQTLRTHQLHCFAATDEISLRRHLAFRDYLRAHPEVSAEYGALKKGLALLHSDDIEQYMDGKDAFVKEIEAQALQWQPR